MANEGYIALPRKIRDHFLWKKERAFSKAEAWIDMLMEVWDCEEPKEVIFGMTVLKCHFGQSLKSLRTWAEKWSWSVNKVRRFFKMLEEHSMIETKNEGVATRLTVCNYGKYNPVRPADAEDFDRD